MARKKGKKPDIVVSNHVVAFVDLLGQQERLRTFGILPGIDDQEVLEAFGETLQATYEAVRFMRHTFADYFAYFSKRKVDTSQLTKEQRSSFGKMKSNPIQFQGFSDSMIVYLSLTTTETNKLPMRGVYGVLGAAGITSLVCLARGHPLRGGIDIGWAAEVSKREIYGSALARAHALESRIAQYPRVVVGEELRRYLELTRDQEASDIISQAARMAAQTCLGLLAEDHDGQLFLDYLGEGFKSSVPDADLAAQLFHEAYDHVKRQCEKSKKEKNTNLAFRYALLEKYFDSRAHLWVAESYEQ